MYFKLQMISHPLKLFVFQKSVDTLSTVINAIFPLSDLPNDSEHPEEISPQILEQTNKRFVVSYFDFMFCSIFKEKVG